MSEKLKEKYNLSIFDDITFAAARILNLIYAVESKNLEQFLRFDDLNYIDFFASHPFLVFDEDQKEYLELRYYGFTKNSLEYINSKHIFSNFREKLKTVFAHLISKDLIEVKAQDKIIKYILTQNGERIAKSFLHRYFEAYRLSAKFILDILKESNQAEIKEFQERWLNNSQNFAII